MEFWSSTVAANRLPPHQLKVRQPVLGKGQGPVVGYAVDVDAILQFFVDKVDAVRDSAASGPTPLLTPVPNNAEMHPVSTRYSQRGRCGYPATTSQELHP